jgi:hypothetical protein
MEESDSASHALLALDQLWPQLQELVEPFGLRRRESDRIGEEGADIVRRKADDLRDPDDALKEGLVK